MSKITEFLKNATRSVLGLNAGNNNMTEQFNDGKFKFGVYLVNQDGRAVKIRKGTIEEFVIIDDILEWFHYGYIVFTNPDDVMERASVQHKPEQPPASDEDKNVIPYRFRGDCRDFLYVYMEPEVIPVTKDSVAEELDNDVYTMEFVFCIHKIEDLTPDNNRMTKLTKLSFHDYRMQLLMEKNTYYSTGKNMFKLGDTSDKQTNVTQMSNSGRSKQTGEIIQDLLSAALPVSDTLGKFSRHWDFGSNNLFYTSPSQYKAYDDIKYVLDRHASEQNSEPCIFKVQRKTERWELLPVSKYFERSNIKGSPGVYQSEYFVISDDGGASEKDIPPPSKTIAKMFNPMLNYHYPDLSVIDNFKFTEMDGSDCQHILNSVVVHRYDEGSKKFSIDLDQGNIDKIHSTFQSLFINKTHGDANQGSGYTNWITDTTRSQNLNIDVKLSWTPDKNMSLTDGRNKKLLSAFMLGNAIQFDVKGMTSRRSGLWIAIDRNNNYTDNEYDKKVLGQYFVTRVVHRITPGGYENNIIGVKPYLYDDPGFSTDDIFIKNPEEIKR